MKNQKEVEKVWYCPINNYLIVWAQGNAGLFKDDNGPFIMFVAQNNSLFTHKFYLIGDL